AVGRRIALHVPYAVPRLDSQAARVARPATVPALGGDEARVHVELRVGGAPALPVALAPRHVRHAATACAAFSRTMSTVMVCMQTRPMGHARRKHGAQGDMPCTASRSQPNGVERAALVAPHSDTTGVPIAAARWSAPESGPKASAQRPSSA